MHLRLARLHLLRHLDAGTEAEVWFSPLVQSRSPTGLMFRQQYLENLRESLRSSGRLAGAWAIIKELHHTAPVAIQIEEELTYLGLHDDEKHAVRIQEKLREVLAALQEGAHRNGLARWALRAIPRLPRTVLAFPETWAVAVTSAVRLGASRVIEGNPPLGAISLPWKELLPRDLARTSVGVTYIEGKWVFSTPATPGTSAFSVPKTSPLLFRVQQEQVEPRETHFIALDSGSSTELALGSPTLTIQSVLGNRWRIEAGDRRRTGRHLKQPRQATLDRLIHELKNKPVIWVGPGLSIAAGYPTYLSLMKTMVGAAPEAGIDPEGDFMLAVDAFMQERSIGELSELLQREIGALEKPVTPLHRSVARLAGADCFSAILTTNYDDLLERALGEEGVPHLLQTLDHNQDVAGTGEVRVLKLHGSYGDWRAAVLKRKSYEDFGPRYGFLLGQLETLMRQRPVLFVGYSLQDPEVLDWMAKLSEEDTYDLRAWHALLPERDWEAAKASRWKGQPSSRLLAKVGLRALLLNDHGHLPKLFAEAAQLLAPAIKVLDRIPQAGKRFGREDLLEELVSAILADPGDPVPVLGQAGIGKSHLTIAALHDPKVEGRFKERRFFVRCEGASTAEAVIGEVARVMGIETADPQAAVESALNAKPTLLVLDNLETPWHNDQDATEELLGRWAGLPALSLVGTLRGESSPQRVSWSKPVVVSPLEEQTAQELFLSIAGSAFSNDPRLGDLLEAVDGLPLAVKLLAHQAVGEPSLEKVWARWREERSALLRRGTGNRRETNLAVSLEFSIRRPTMTTEARRLLSVLSLLPDGAALEDLPNILPYSNGHDSATALERTGLASWEADRLRTLSPVREYVRKEHPAPTDDQYSTVAHYFALASSLGPKAGMEGGREATERLSPEVANLESLLLMEIHESSHEAIRVAIALANFHRFSGLGTTRALEAAIKLAREHEERALEAQCLNSLGDINLQRSDYTAARKRYAQALQLYEIVGDLLRQANCIARLGDIDLRQSDYPTARKRYEQALPLFETTGDLLGQAIGITRLGDISMQMSDHSAAQLRYEQSLPLFETLGHLLGQANCLRRLGDIYLLRSDHTAARQHYEQAFPLYEMIGDILGQANCITRLGDIDLRRSDHGTAKQRYEQALQLYEMVSDILGQANAITRLGDIDLQRSDHASARERYEQALGMYSKLPEPYSMGQSHQRLARLALDRADQKYHAEEARRLWTLVDRPDLVADLESEFRGVLSVPEP